MSLGMLSSSRPAVSVPSSLLEIVSPWPLVVPTPAPVWLEVMLTELNAMFLEWPVLDVSGCDGVFELGLFWVVDDLAACVFKLWAFLVSMFLRRM